jgi:glycerophosphoryl diester phosphodiesterase
MSTLATARPISPTVCAHACTVDGGPPNTLSGLRTLVARGVEMVEIDVRLSGDGVLVAHHDNRLPDRRLVRDVSAEEIVSAYPPERRPARLDALLSAVGLGTRLQLDLKEEGVEEEALRLALSVMPARGVFVTTLSASQVACVKGLRRGVHVGLSLNRSPLAYLHGLAQARQQRADLLAIHHTYLRKRLAARAAAAGLPLFVWTVDDDAGLARALRDPRVACVITGRPLRARALRDA